MKTEKGKISKIKNNPNNPRLIKDDKFKKLVKSVKEFPEMLEIRPIVVDKDNIVLGGNMRLRACQEAGLKEVHIIQADKLTEKQQREFIIKDNVGFGEWDWDDLANEWEVDELGEWGLDLPLIMEEPSADELIDNNNIIKPPTIKITFNNENDLEKAEKEICDIINKYDKAFYSVSLEK